MAAERNDDPTGPVFEDVPLPGFESQAAPPSSTTPATKRAYSATQAITESSIQRFWSRVVKAPGDGCWIWTGAISGGDGYGRNRAELHLVGYSTAG